MNMLIFLVLSTVLPTFLMNWWQNEVHYLFHLERKLDFGLFVWTVCLDHIWLHLHCSISKSLHPYAPYKPEFVAILAPQNLQLFTETTNSHCRVSVCLGILWVSIPLSAHTKRFSVFYMRDFWFPLFFDRFHYTALHCTPLPLDVP